MNENAKAGQKDAPTPVSAAPKKIKHLHLLAVVLTILGIGLFAYFIYSVGVDEILEGIWRIGIFGYLFILLIYFGRLLVRATAWKLCVNEPHKLSLADTLQAVVIGEALSSMIPLGIVVSGTAKAVAVRRRVPFVIGLSSIATENLFYSLGTGIFIALGAIGFLRTFELSQNWIITIDVLIGIVFLLIILGILMVVRQWHFASAICQKLYERGFLTKFLERGRFGVREFENQIYGFYRRYPQRFAPILLLQVIFHCLGILEIWFILSRISEVAPQFLTAFLLESVSRVITVVFKLIPFVVGVDEAGAQFVTDTLALGAGVGVMLAIIRKGRVLFWTALGVAMILKREISVTDIFSHKHPKESEIENQN